jgi:hypothetical protein
MHALYCSNPSAEAEHGVRIKVMKEHKYGTPTTPAAEMITEPDGVRNVKPEE